MTRLVVGRDDLAAKALAALDHVAELDLGLVADEALEVAGAHQRPVDAGRRDLEVILAVDRILDVEHRRQILAQPLAVGDGEAPVGILGHDLQRRAVLLA